jgi:hypothetical protein
MLIKFLPYLQGLQSCTDIYHPDSSVPVRTYVTLVRLYLHVLPTTLIRR